MGATINGNVGSRAHAFSDLLGHISSRSMDAFNPNDFEKRRLVVGVVVTQRAAVAHGRHLVLVRIVAVVVLQRADQRVVVVVDRDRMGMLRCAGEGMRMLRVGDRV